MVRSAVMDNFFDFIHSIEQFKFDFRKDVTNLLLEFLRDYIKKHFHEFALKLKKPFRFQSHPFL